MLARLSNGSFAAGLAISALLVVLPAEAQRTNSKFQKGDKVEVKDGFDWKTGTVVRTEETGWVEVRLDDESMSDLPKHVRDSFRMRPYPPQDVRASKKTAAGQGAGRATAARPWTDRTGKFSVVARFDGVNDFRVGLIKADGKRIEVPLEKLSEADVQYVRELTKEEENPFADPGDAQPAAAPGAGNVGSSAAIKKANWREVKAIRPQTFSKWSYTPPASAGGAGLSQLANAPTTEVMLNEIPDSQKFFEEVDGVYIASDGARAIVCRQQGVVGNDKQPYLEVVDLKKGEAISLVPLPPDTAVLDVDPDSALVAYRSDQFHFGTKTELTIARLENGTLTPVAQWEPYAHETFPPRRDVEKAWFLAKGRLLTVNRHAQAMTVWDMAQAKALINVPVRTSIMLKTALSPDRTLLGVVMNEAVAIIDLIAGRHVATIPTPGKQIHQLAFRGDNAKLAAVSDEGLTAWDLSTGKEIGDLFHSATGSHGGLAWAGEYLLVQNRYLFDLERRILLWEYQNTPGSDGTAIARDGRIWIVPNDRHQSQTVLIAAALPDAEALEIAKSLPSAEELLVVKPGAAVALEIDIDSSVDVGEELRKSFATNADQDGGAQPNIVVLNAAGAQQDVIRDRLAAALSKAGLSVVEESKLVVKAVCKPQPQQTIRINVDGRWPIRQEDIVERTVTPHASYLEMTLDGEVLWKRGFVATPGAIIFINRDESLDQALERLTKPNLGLFTNAKFSAYVARPGTATPEGAYGVSRFTASGLIAGQSEFGNQVVFE